jgi:hypothetical protein
MWYRSIFGMSPLTLVAAWLTIGAATAAPDAYWRADIFAPPMPVHNLTSVEVLVRPDTEAIALWVCMPDNMQTVHCVAEDDSPRLSKSDRKNCVYITQACECIQWFSYDLVAASPGWTLYEQGQGCTRLVYNPEGRVQNQTEHAILHDLTLRWKLDAAGISPSNTAIEWAYKSRTPSADMLDMACAYASRLTGVLQKTMSVWGCEYRVRFGVWIRSAFF